MFHIMSSFIHRATEVTRETVHLKRDEKQRGVHMASSLLAGSVSLLKQGRGEGTSEGEDLKSAGRLGRWGVGVSRMRSSRGQGGWSSGAAAGERTSSQPDAGCVIRPAVRGFPSAMALGVLPYRE